MDHTVSIDAVGASGDANPMLVAIDGPAGSGKSSVARRSAELLEFGILDTGAAYRSLAWAALHAGSNLDDPDEIEALFDRWRFNITLRGAQFVTVSFGDEPATDVTVAIRSPEISGAVSRVSKHPRVRERLNAMFLRLVAESGLRGVIIEGRDITTVVAPDAPVRILLTAAPEIRAARRARELPELSAESVFEDLIARDAKDALVVDFLNPAPGVTLIDTSELNFEQSVDAVLEVVRSSAAWGSGSSAEPRQER